MSTNRQAQPPRLFGEGRVSCGRHFHVSHRPRSGLLQKEVIITKHALFGATSIPTDTDVLWESSLTLPTPSRRSAPQPIPPASACSTLSDPVSLVPSCSAVSQAARCCTRDPRLHAQLASSIKHRQHIKRSRPPLDHNKASHRPCPGLPVVASGNLRGQKAEFPLLQNCRPTAD